MKDLTRLVIDAVGPAAEGVHACKIMQLRARGQEVPIPGLEVTETRTGDRSARLLCESAERLEDPEILALLSPVSWFLDGQVAPPCSISGPEWVDRFNTAACTSTAGMQSAVTRSP